MTTPKDTPKLDAFFTIFEDFSSRGNVDDESIVRFAHNVGSHLAGARREVQALM